jgi:EpsI family protein
LFNYRMLIINGILLAAIIGGHFGRQIESAVINKNDFLKNTNSPFRDWKSKDLTIPKTDLALLQPDDALARVYTAPDGKQSAELLVIAGHRKRSIHTPGYCMIGDGWEVLDKHAGVLDVGDRKIPIVRTLMTKESHQKLVTHFFTDGDYCTNNLLRFQGVQLVRRLRAELPIGAVIRMAVMVDKDPGAAEVLSNQFAQATVPEMLNTLRQIKLKVD